MVGYSGAPLVKKLGIRPGDAIALLDRPPDWTIDRLPEDVTVCAPVRAGRSM